MFFIFPMACQVPDFILFCFESWDKLKRCISAFFFPCFHCCEKQDVKIAASFVSSFVTFLISERITENGDPGEEVCKTIKSFFAFFNSERRKSFCSADFPPTTSFPDDV